MRYIKPFYFDDFKCAADKCPDTCCAGWQIMIDDETLARYQQEKGVFSVRLAGGIDWQEGCFRQYRGRCSMLNEKNLCDLVSTMGEEALCRTCSQYPRHEEEFEGLREWSLSLSCPVAAEMILGCEESLRFSVEEDEEDDPLEEEFEEFDFLLFTQLEEARRVLFQIVSDRTYSVEQRICLILEMAGKMQACVDEDRLYDMDALIASYESEEKTRVETQTAQSEQIRYHKLKEQFEVFKQMEQLYETWADVLSATQELYEKNAEEYCQIRQDFRKEYAAEGMLAKRWELFRENVLIFFLYTYFCGAVYDGWVYSKVALAVFSVLFIEEFVMCRWNLADKNISWQECVELAYRYAREVEHSDDNLNLLEEWLQENTRG